MATDAFVRPASAANAPESLSLSKGRPRYHRPWRPRFENREAWGSLDYDGADGDQMWAAPNTCSNQAFRMVKLPWSMKNEPRERLIALVRPIFQIVGSLVGSTYKALFLVVGYMASKEGEYRTAGRYSGQPIFPVLDRGDRKGTMVEDEGAPFRLCFGLPPQWLYLLLVYTRERRPCCSALAASCSARYSRTVHCRCRPRFDRRAGAKAREVFVRCRGIIAASYGCLERRIF